MGAPWLDTSQESKGSVTSNVLTEKKKIRDAGTQEGGATSFAGHLVVLL